MYKGIPLRITVKNSGFFSERKAVQVILNQPIPPEQFKLPEYPIVVDDDYSSDESANIRMQDVMASVHDLKDKLKTMGFKNIDENTSFSPEQEREMIDTLGARYLAKQKKYLPKLLKSMEKAKECIRLATTGDEAQKCIKPVNEINAKLGDRTLHFEFSKFTTIKKDILNSLSTEINYLKVQITV